MKASTLITFLALVAPLLAVPISTPQELNLDQRCKSYSSYPSSLKSITRAWRSKTSNRKSYVKSGPVSEPHFPIHQLVPTSKVEHVEVGILSRPLPATEEVKEQQLDGMRLLPPPMAQKIQEIDRPEPTMNPGLEAVLRGTHKDTARSAQAAEMISEAIRKNEVRTKAKEMKNVDAALESAARQTNGAPIPTSVLLQSSKVAPKCCENVDDLRDIIFEGKRFGLTSWIKSKPCAAMRDAKIITYTLTYVNRDSTDVLVVGLVMVFLIAVLVTELLQKFVDRTRAFFGTRSGAIRLGDNDLDCESGLGFRPVYTPRGFKVSPAPSTWSPRSRWIDEKTGGLYVIEETCIE